MAGMSSAPFRYFTFVRDEIVQGLDAFPIGQLFDLGGQRRLSPLRESLAFFRFSLSLGFWLFLLFFRLRRSLAARVLRRSGANAVGA